MQNEHIMCCFLCNIIDNDLRIQWKSLQTSQHGTRNVKTRNRKTQKTKIATSKLKIHAFLTFVVKENNMVNNIKNQNKNKLPRQKLQLK